MTVMTVESAKLALTLSRHEESKKYLEELTDNFRLSQSFGNKLDPKAVFNTYISAVSKCAVSLIKTGLILPSAATAEDVNAIAFTHAKSLFE